MAVIEEQLTGATSNIGSKQFMQLAPSPINVAALEKELVGYNENEASFLRNGFRFGFPIQYTGPRIATDTKNLKSVNDRPDIVQEKIDKELKEHRVAGPFKERPIDTLRIYIELCLDIQLIWNHYWGRIC